MSDLKVRDHKDSNRDNSPLRKANDAVQIDTSNLSIDEQVNFIINHISPKIIARSFLSKVANCQEINY